MSAGGAFADVLEGCRPLIPVSLIGPDGWERLLDRARRLPRSVLDTYFGFEFRLGEPGAEADLFVVCRPGTDIARHYMAEGARAEPGSPAAAFAATLREQAENPDSFLARSVVSTVLEYDLADLPAGRPPPPPGIFLAPRSAGPGPYAHRDPAGLLEALAGAVGWSGHEALLPQVERVFAAAPETGRIFQAGALPGRSPKAFRILLRGFANDEVPALLKRLEWPGPLETATDALAFMDDLVAFVAVGVDVTGRGVAPRLGLELYRGPLWFQVDRTIWRPFVARLEEKGWCLPEKADGLLRWPGSERLIGPGGMHLVRQGINHVKLVIEPDAPITAKAYAGMCALAVDPARRPPPS